MKYYNVKEFGAVGNGTHDDGKSIQKAIDLCCENGGGTVVLESGNVFFSSSIALKKNVELHIQKGAVLKATDNIENYIRPCETINDPKTALVGNPVTGKPSFAFIYGFEADGATISGGGTIDGNCYAFVERKSEYYVTGNFYPRPTVIYIEKSNNITVKDVTIKNAPFWTLHPAGCDDVLISQIRILNPLDVANSDGIDPDHCSNVRIVNCHVECADDCICLKTSKGNSEYGPCENIVITGCTLVSTSAAIKIGTEGVGDFRNVIVDNCIISRSNRGLSIQVRDCGNVENVSFSNIMIETRRFCSDWWGTAEPITITAFRRDENTVCGHVKNIRYYNVTCKGENGVLIHGTENNLIEDVSFEKVSVTLEKTSKWPCGMYDLRPCIDYGIEQDKNACFYLRNVDGISFVNSKAEIKGKSEFYSCAVDAKNVNGMTFEKFTDNAMQ
ncbi:MAG: glycosyl hydrolase family 28 protein [Faecalibacterium sp.]|nr:glycosyl hydrolase family 28 protein [Ruminococcus sp.]MCM1392009.1 glycosyl hydrolase family 28 protein [Ruminococcus sp.]MCM1485731.1 glycosyl hydrolase family 28 protein [Faecalibacterium sp.]